MVVLPETCRGESGGVEQALGAYARSARRSRATLAARKDVHRGIQSWKGKQEALFTRKRGEKIWAGDTAQIGTWCRQEEHATATSATRNPVRRRDGRPGTDASHMLTCRTETYVRFQPKEQGCTACCEMPTSRWRRTRRGGATLSAAFDPGADENLTRGES